MNRKWCGWLRVNWNNRRLWAAWDRDFECYNDSFLEKLIWCLIDNPPCLLSRVLFGKYCHEESFLTVKQGSYVSHGWHGILVGRNLTWKHAGWVVGDGTNVRIWDDAWLSQTHQERPMVPVSEPWASLKVADLLIAESKEWNVEAIQRWLPDYVEQIRLIKPSITGAPDKLAWLNTNSGIFTTKSRYHAALKESEDGKLPIWVWRIGIEKYGDCQ